MIDLVQETICTDVMDYAAKIDSTLISNTGTRPCISHATQLISPYIYADLTLNSAGRLAAIKKRVRTALLAGLCTCPSSVFNFA